METMLIILGFGIILGVVGGIAIRKMFHKRSSKTSVQEHQILIPQLCFPSKHLILFWALIPVD